MKVLIVGEKKFSQYAPALVRGMKDLPEIEVYSFFWDEYLWSSNLPLIIKKIENKLSEGLICRKINKRLLDYVNEINPDIVFLYTCRCIRSDIVKHIADMGIFVISYCNDNPFSEYFRSYFWRHYRNALPFCSINYVYRKTNIPDVEKRSKGAVKLLYSYYMNDRNYPIKDDQRVRETPEVIFMGHYEDDNRVEYLTALTSVGIPVGVPAKEYRRMIGINDKFILLENELEWYNRYICSCKIPIVFLSTLNKDTYTRRCFEIPASGAFLFCPYTEDLAEMYTENEEIVFYRNKEEFVAKVQYYLEHDVERKRIAENGRRRLLAGGHEVTDRARQIIDDYRFCKDKSGQKNL